MKAQLALMRRKVEAEAEPLAESEREKKAKRAKPAQSDKELTHREVERVLLVLWACDDSHALVAQELVKVCQA